jgi:hypothetical protein
MSDFGRAHWLMMIGMSLLAIAFIFGLGFLLELVAGQFA